MSDTELNLMNSLWKKLRLKATRGVLLSNFVWTMLALMIGYVVMHFGLEKRMSDYVVKDLKESLSFISKPFEQTTTQKLVTWCEQLDRKSGKRFTIMDHEGNVLCDNYAQAENMVNHADRPEFMDALSVGHGDSARASKTIDKEMLYASTRLIDSLSQQPLVLRIALPQNDLAYYLSKMRMLVLKNLFAVFVVLTLIFIFSSLKVATPLRRLEKKLSLFKSSHHTIDRSNIEVDNEWEKVDLTVDQIYKELDTQIREVKDSNEKISTIVESISDGLLAIDRNEQIILTNNTFYQLFNLAKNDNNTKAELIDYIRDIDIRKSFQDSIRLNKTVIKKIKIIDKSFELRTYPIQSAASTFGAVGIFHDISEIQLLQQMREDFVANVSHEVRTPLTALKGYAQIMSTLSAEDHEHFTKYASKIEHNVNRLTALFQDILSLSVLESRDSIQKETIQLDELSSTVFANLSHSHFDKKIKLKTEIKQNQLFVDPNLFEQVLTNLFDNAIKYSDQDGFILIKSFIENDKNIIEIIDNGIGIPESAMKRVFERFYRVDESRSRAIGGTGLGLAIVKHAIQKHQGLVSVHANQPNGTIFRIILPIA